MAGGEDYIPIRTALVDDPDVLALARTLGKDRDLIVGKLVRFWSFAARVTPDGRLGPYSPKEIDEVVGCRGFCYALETFRAGHADPDRRQGWLLKDAETGELSIPKWDEWMSKSAKARAGEAVRKKLQRSCPDKCPDKRPDQSRGEERREEQKAAAESKKTPEISEQQAEGRAPALGSDAQRDICSLLLARVRLLKPTEAAAIAQEPQATRERVLWAIDRWADQEAKADRGAAGRVENPAGYIRSLVQSENGPTPAWRKRNMRRVLGIEGARAAAKENTHG